MVRITEAMSDADFVQLDGIVFAAVYLRVPDESTDDEDVVMELNLGEVELAFTLGELDGAEYLHDGMYRLKSGALLRFLTVETLH